ncbi:MAG TPA: SIS domain-containing protein [Thermomicrobiales bacterium]|nr:SIS domain-containing protein [Thermomicrobiales bacterium]
MVVYRDYFRRLYDIIEEVVGSQGPRIETAATWMAESIANQGVVHLFGSGHSHMVAEEVFHRAGSLLPLNPILDANLTFFGMVNATILERTSGYAKAIFGAQDIRAGEVVIVASNSGVNPVPIEAVLEARARGARTIAITSDHYYTAVPSRHESGKRLAEVADLTIDTRIPQGDALVRIRDVEFPVGGASSAVGVAIINAIVVETTDRLRKLGVTPPVIPTMNLPGGDERMEELIKAYGDRLPLLRRA